MNETTLRDKICELGRSMFERRLTHGSTGNISARTDAGWLLTPTGSSLGRLDPARLSKLDWDGKLLSGDPPSKESYLHLAMYREGKRNTAVVHLHSTHSVAVSVLENIDPNNALPPITAYYVMRVGTLPLIPYYPPGDAGLAEAVGRLAGKHRAMLLANHGPVVAGTSLSAAADAIEELEETSRIYLMLRGERLRLLDGEEVAELHRKWPA